MARWARCWRARTPCFPPVSTSSPCRGAFARRRAHLPPATAATSSSSPRPHGASGIWRRATMLLDRMLPSTAAAKDAGRLGALLDRTHRPRPARADTRRPAQRPDRPGDEPVPASTRIDDVPAAALFEPGTASTALRERGEAALRSGEVAVATYSAGVGSRWTQGGGAVKGLHPFAETRRPHGTSSRATPRRRGGRGAPPARTSRTSSPPATSRMRRLSVS